MKRFYKLVAAQKQPGGGHAILLDGRVLKTPARHLLTVESAALADEIAREWMAQGEEIIPASMPLTQIVSTMLDRVAAERSVMTATVLKYLNTDLLCYRTDFPPELAERQALTWDKWLEWATEKFGGRFETTTGLRALMQPEILHANIKAHVQALDDAHFTALQLVTAVSGSLVLALAFAALVAGADDVFAATHVEEAFKAGIYDEERYGPDPAQGKKDEAVYLDLKAAEQFLRLL